MPITNLEAPMTEDLPPPWAAAIVPPRFDFIAQLNEAKAHSPWQCDTWPEVFDQTIIEAFAGLKLLDGRIKESNIKLAQSGNWWRTKPDAGQRDCLIVNLNDGRLNLWLDGLKQANDQATLESMNFDETPLGKIYKAVANSNDHNAPTRVRASSVTDCERQWFYQIKQAEATDNPSFGKPQWKVSAFIGTAMHAALEMVFAWTDELHQQEFVVEVPGIFGGKVDLNLPNRKVLIDYKTVKHADYQQGALGEKVGKYFAQLSSYGAITGDEIAVVVLISRNTYEMQTIWLKLDEYYGASLIDRSREIMRQIKADELPKPEMLAKDGCFFCTFKQRCASDGV